MTSHKFLSNEIGDDILLKGFRQHRLSVENLISEEKKSQNKLEIVLYQEDMFELKSYLVFHFNRYYQEKLARIFR